MSFTKEEKQKYFKELRTSWKKSKELSENDEVAQALFREAGMNVSYASFYFTLQQMRALKMEGIPYVDCKTFNKWKESGYIVKKGEKSKVNGITWISGKKEDENDEEKKLYPKVYKLFHKSQVEELEGGEKNE